MKRNTFTLLLALVLCLSLFSGCRAADPEPTPTPTPSETVEITPDVPNTIVDVTDPETTPETDDFTVEVEGIPEQVSMTLVSGSFRHMGGPEFSLYVDKTRYQVTDVDGYCYITLEAGDSIYGEIGFRPDTDAETLSAAFLREYGNMQQTQDGGDVTLGDYTARHLTGETMTSVFDAYLIDVDGGCVTLVICTPGEAVEGHGIRLLASFETLKLE